ncbi:hypothetical protein NDU88_004050 [Pleurodeles waltl]|uniref:Uncharacterized protein n=1 Tax=Pleurodeles waltl TaxID=8319 RepID=A0AAV7QAR4_PLEWA|nr:hypothetical protein NDU88_004050 [Pleurodeles waltl]
MPCCEYAHARSELPEIKQSRKRGIASIEQHKGRTKPNIATERRKARIGEHMRMLKNCDMRYPIVAHILSCDSQSIHKSFKFFGLEHVPRNPRGGNRELMLRRKEATWIMRLKAVELGLNTDRELEFFLGDRG